MIKLKILFFLASAAPTPEEELQIANLDFPVQKRNASFADVVEPCDGVLGEVPDLFKDFPNGEKVYKDAKAAHIADLRKRGAELPPVTTPEGEDAPEPTKADKDAAKKAAKEAEATQAKVDKNKAEAKRKADDAAAKAKADKEAADKAEQEKADRDDSQSTESEWE